MLLETKKLHIIEEVLKIDNDSVLTELEAYLDKAVKTTDSAKFNAQNFSGIWTQEEADEIADIIEEACENINPDDWK